jgi:hypothetical protein
MWCYTLIRHPYFHRSISIGRLTFVYLFVAAAFASRSRIDRLPAPAVVPSSPPAAAHPCLPPPPLPFCRAPAPSAAARTSRSRASAKSRAKLLMEAEARDPWLASLSLLPADDNTSADAASTGWAIGVDPDRIHFFLSLLRCAGRRRFTSSSLRGRLRERATVSSPDLVSSSLSPKFELISVLIFVSEAVLR